MTKRGRTGCGIGFFLLIVLVGGLGAAAYWWRWAGRPAGVAGVRPVRVTVVPGATTATVGKELERQGVIRSAFAFGLRARRQGKNNKPTPLVPGVYDVSPAEAPERILRRLVLGDVAKAKVTFPEGFTLRQIARRLGARGLADERRFLELTSRSGNTLRASFRPPAKLEGYLFPDTYTFPLGASEQAVAQQMLGNFDRLVARGQVKRRGGNGRRSLSEVVTIASLVEREARMDRDRARIAGVIYNRLKKNMPLQIDATVQYARGQHVARLLYRDLGVASPYNTYKRKGLPPGPICSPGMASIRAALAPETHPYLYYVARPDGSHVFGKTFAEHQHNIARVRSGRG